MRDGLARCYAPRPRRAAYVAAPGGFYVAALDGDGRVIAEGPLALAERDVRDSAEEFGAIGANDVHAYGHGWWFVGVCRGWIGAALRDMGFDAFEQRVMTFEAQGAKRA